MQEIHGPEHVGKLPAKTHRGLAAGREEFLGAGGRASRGATSWISIPPAALLRGLDGMVGRRRQAAGDRFRTTPPTSSSGWRRCPGSPARRCASSTPSCRADLRRPAVDDARDLVAAHSGASASASRCRIPATPYWIFLALALLCGFGGGNFASSMANISFFFPKAEKGNALALNAGLGNLGVSVVQFVVPLVITAGVFGWLGGDPQIATDAGGDDAALAAECRLHLGAVHCCLGIRRLVRHERHRLGEGVLRRSVGDLPAPHNWIMCWLYTGTFGSFIGYSAGFPLLAKMLFPEINALQYAFLGPLVGALSRALTAGSPTAGAAAASLSGCSSPWPRRRRRPLLPGHKGSRQRSRASSRGSCSCSSRPASATLRPSR